MKKDLKQQWRKYYNLKKPEQFLHKLTKDASRIGFWCPGCKELHVINDTWVFSGTGEKPTVKPSVRVSSSDKTKCHLFLTDGQIQFLSDCLHELAGKTVPMQKI